jgi:hypothetical protein
MSKNLLLSFQYLLIFIFSLLYLFTYFAEIIPVKGGVGYDGIMYKSIAEYGLGLLKKREMLGYYVFRCVPFIFYDILGLISKTDNVLNFFKIFNLVSIGLAIFYYFNVSKHLQWNNNTSNLGFILLFFTFPILKFVNYYPLLTDHFSFTLSIAGVYYYFKRNHFMNIIVLMLSLFSLPTLTFLLFLLLIMDKRNKLRFLSINKIFVNWSFKIILILLLSIPFIFYFTIADNKIQPVNYSTYLNKDLLILSSFMLFLFFIFIAWSLNKAITEFNKDFNIQFNLFYIVLSISLFLLMKWVFNNFISTPNVGLYSFEGIAYRALTMPLNFLIYHVFYFGLAIIFILLFIKGVFIESLELNIGWFIVVFVILIFFIENESRKLTNMIIFLLIPFLQKVNKDIKMNNLKFIFIFIFSVLISRFYIQLDNNSNMWKLMEDPNEFSKFPVQRYFMNQGPWVSYEMYYLQAYIFVFLFVVVFFLFRKNILSKNIVDEGKILQ